jgi:hypothetical protein
MLRKAELDQLGSRKELLVRQCNAHRMLLAAEWRRLRSTESWRSEARSSVRKHPMLAAALGVGAGLIAIRFLRRPSAVISWLGQLGGASSALWSIWKMFGGDGRRQ